MENLLKRVHLADHLDLEEKEDIVLKVIIQHIAALNVMAAQKQTAE